MSAFALPWTASHGTSAESVFFGATGTLGFSCFPHLVFCELFSEKLLQELVDIASFGQLLSVDEVIFRTESDFSVKGNLIPVRPCHETRCLLCHLLPPILEFLFRPGCFRDSPNEKSSLPCLFHYPFYTIKQCFWQGKQKS